MLAMLTLPCVADLKTGPTNWISPGGFLPYFWNQVGAAGIGDKTQIGNWVFGLNNTIPNGPPDDGFLLIKKAGAGLYVEGRTAEFQVGAAGNVVVPPYVDLRTQSAGWTWQTQDIDFPFTVTYHMWLVRDVCRWEYRITNNTSNAHRIGFRVYESLHFNYDSGKNPTAGPYIIPNAPPSTLAKEWGGTQDGLNPSTYAPEDPVPDEWSIRNSPIDHQPAAPDYLPFLTAKQPLSDLTNSWVTKPDRMVISTDSEVQAYGWDKILTALDPANWQQKPAITQGVDLVGTGAGTESVGLLYALQSVQPGETKIYRGEVRMNWCEVSPIPSTNSTASPSPYALAVQAPEWVGYRPGPDPNDATTTVGHFSPNPVTINAFLCNSTQLVEPAASVTIDVGKDLDLVSGPMMYTGDTIPDLVDKNYQWQVRVKPTASGKVPVRVTATFTPGGSVTVTRYINVPALPAQTLQAGDYFTGFPYTFTDPSATVALGLGNSVKLAWYDPVAHDYRYAASDGVKLAAGRGYWLNMATPTTVTLQGASTLDQRKAIWLPLSAGWNAISNPYQFSIIWGYCHIFYNSQEITVPDAISQGLIRRELWTWDPTQNIYNPPVNPAPIEDLGGLMDPNQGFWLYATTDLSLIFEPNPFLPPMDPATPSARSRVAQASSARTAGRADAWQINLMTETEKARDLLATFGVASGNVTTLRANDIMKPPVSPAGLSTYFPHRDWGKQAGDYAVDIQAPAAAYTWTAEVQCMKANQQVTIRWPDLTQLPAKMPLMLKDELTGKTLAMRTNPGYTFNSGNGGVRRFTITAGGSVARLQFTQVSAATGRGAAGTTITFATSVAADVTGYIRTMTGRLVRTLSINQPTGGLTTSHWDGRDDQGRLLPGGNYLCELYAESQDGQRMRTMLTLRLR